MSLDFMNDNGVFLPMLNDVGRNNFYKAALTHAAPGKTVCDIGAGTGFLSLLAVDAGAKHVIAVERDKARCAYMQQLLDRVGYSDSIEIVQGDFLDLDIAADVYVTETINTQIFGEDIIKLSNHASRYGGAFIPQGFRIWPEVYENHPVFVLDLAKSEAYNFEPGIDVNKKYIQEISQDFTSQYDLDDTVFRANQLNRLFTMLPNFTDIKLNKLYQGTPVDINLDHYNDEMVEIKFPTMLDGFAVMSILKWQAYYNQITLNSDQCWFGNVAKYIRTEFATQSEIKFRYDPQIRDWRLQY